MAGVYICMGVGRYPKRRIPLPIKMPHIRYSAPNPLERAQYPLPRQTGQNRNGGRSRGRNRANHGHHANRGENPASQGHHARRRLGRSRNQPGQAHITRGGNGQQPHREHHRHETPNSGPPEHGERGGPPSQGPENQNGLLDHIYVVTSRVHYGWVHIPNGNAGQRS